MASSNAANWSVYSRNGKPNVEEPLWWFQGPKYLQFALRATRIHLTPTSYQQSRQLFIRHKLAHQSKIRVLVAGKSQTRRGGLWLTALPFAKSSSSPLPKSTAGARHRVWNCRALWGWNTKLEISFLGPTATAWRQLYILSLRSLHINAEGSDAISLPRLGD